MKTETFSNILKNCSRKMYNCNCCYLNTGNFKSNIITCEVFGSGDQNCIAQYNKPIIKTNAYVRNFRIIPNGLLLAGIYCNNFR